VKIEIPEQDKLTSSLLNNLGIAIGGEPGGATLPTAVAMLKKAFRLNPLDCGRMLNLASVLIRSGEDEEAEHLVTICINRDPKLWLSWQIMGWIRTNQGKLDEAIQCFKRAYDLEPDGQRTFDLAAALMRAGDFKRGLPLYERRHEILPKTSPPPPVPEWKGEKVGHLAVCADQGHGDRIMFARFLPWARERCDKLTFITDPASIPLLVGYSKIADIQCGWNDEMKIERWVSLGSLPLLYGMTATNIPPDPGLLNAAKTEGQLGARGLKIGIVWFGNAAFPGNDLRTVPFTDLLPLAADPRNSIFSLQVGPHAGDISKYRAQRLVHDMCGQIEGDWSQTAALLKNLDLVVSNCTAVAHLAGALRVPTFVMIPRFPDWRWLWGREDTPWYPTMRLFRQERTGEWKSVVKRVVAAVDQMHEQRAVSAILVREETDAEISRTGDKEPDVAAVLRRVLRPGDHFVDVGANVGMHTELGAQLVGLTGKVLACEPGENALPELRAKFPMDVEHCVLIVDRPLWSRSEKRAFYLCADGSGGNALWDPALFPANDKTRAHPQKHMVETRTLDLECHVHNIAPRLIKIDTEGAEQRILEGATEVLYERKPPYIVAELHEFGLNQLGCSQMSLRTFMAKAGYQTFQIFSDGSRPELVPQDKKIVSNWIINLLFSTEKAVNEAWPEAAPDTAYRPLFGYAEQGVTSSGLHFEDAAIQS
jgi:FkbM family methyltransferase